jgi:aconitase B
MLHKIDCFDELALAATNMIPDANVVVHRTDKDKIICEISATSAFKGLADGIVLSADRGTLTSYLETNFVALEQTIETRYVGTHGMRRRIAEVVNQLSGYELLQP